MGAHQVTAPVAVLVQRAHAIVELRRVGSMRSALGRVIYTYLQPVCLCGWEGGLHYGADGMDKASARAEHARHVREDNARLAAEAGALANTCTEKVNVGGHATNDGRWVGADRHTCALTLDEHEVIGTGGRARRVHLDGSTQHAWTTCNGPKHDGGTVPCWCARRAA